MDFKIPFVLKTKHEKKWGEEYWIVNEPEYCAKFLCIKNGWRTSLHYHKNKKETFFLLNGEIEVRNETDYVKHLLPGDTLTLRPEELHSIIGIKDSVILEISTHHEEADSYRFDESGKI